jgi:hypothetical protein
VAALRCCRPAGPPVATLVYLASPPFATVLHAACVLCRSGHSVVEADPFTLFQVQLLIDRPGNEWTMHELVRPGTTSSADRQSESESPSPGLLKPNRDTVDKQISCCNP